jgi:tetratricopeptide (TPR) repeat protein
MIQKQLLSVFFMILSFTLFHWTGVEAQPSAKTKALVVGTIHQKHGSNENYSYADIAYILENYDPDLICVEIRPKDFRREPYLKEMTLATIWGLSHGKKVASIDWWDDANNDREIRDQLEKQPEYVQKEKQFQALRAQSETISRYEKQYGSEEKVWGGNRGYQFWNGKEYNDYYTEDYRISMQVYGDSPINLHYLTRNNRMMGLIWSAIGDNSSRKVIVLTGGEHKHFFDREFRKNPDIETIEFESLLPLKKPTLDLVTRKFLDEDEDLSYYEKGYPKDLDLYYRFKLVPLIHGKNMDVHPETILPANIELAGKVLNRWKESIRQSDGADFDEGWVSFLRENYAGAIQRFRLLAQRIDEGKVTDPFYRIETYVNLGRCYDQLGEREKAMACYTRGEELMRGTPFEDRKDYILQNYKTVPYQRTKVKM